MAAHRIEDGPFGGLFVPTCVPAALALPLGSPVRVKILLGSARKRLLIFRGRVHWKRFRDFSGFPAGLGVAFTAADVALQNRLWSYQAGAELFYIPRRSSRVSVKLRVESCTEGSAFEGYTEDVSLGGLFVQTTSLLPLRQPVIFAVEPIKGSGRLLLEARVAWHRTRFGPPGMGLKLPDEIQSERLESFLSEIAPDQLG